MGDGWSEVNRRCKKSDEDAPTTTMFVTNLPEGLRPEELRRPFEKFGKINDIYLAKKKDLKRRCFAFVRYSGVRDVLKLEANIQGITCKGYRLEVNIAKDGRSYAEVAARKNNKAVQKSNPPPPPPPPPLITPPLRLHTGTFMEHWLKSELTIVGETISFEHLTSLPMSLLVGDDEKYNTKYLGGLKIGMRFRNPTDVERFMESSDDWKLWIKWIEKGDRVEIKNDRIAWVKIVGLPLHFWDEENFREIISKLGVLSSSIEISMNTSDVSHMKLCILTESLSRINEEVTVVGDNQVFKVGIFEVDDDWKPFSNSMMESEEEDEEDGVSDTLFDPDDELEDGEIGPDAEFVMRPGAEIRRNLHVDVSDETPAGSAIVAPSNSAGIHPSEFTPIESPRNLEDMMEVNNVEDVGESGSPQASSRCIRDLIPKGMFGPFPNNGPGVRTEPSNPVDLEMDLNGSFLKRRKIRQATNKTHTNTDQSIPVPVRPSPSLPAHLDLNRDPNGSLNTAPDPPYEIAPTTIPRNSKMEKTAEVGRLLGFDIRDGCEILADVMGDLGDQIGAQ
ncbi:unnamed protein product [Lactuca saligna]|uniref:RRM domain-containing protein n=1 Tax=Lactuca saligna TaxID=75948 RepID=A0AA36A1I0_LACSI|nr:unnamed protein product [Lactuca saligna]